MKAGKFEILPPPAFLLP